MKKNRFNFSRKVAATIIITAIIIVAAISCFFGWVASSIAPTISVEQARVVPALQEPVQQNQLSADDLETTELVQHLINDHLIVEANGFIVEKRENLLYIGGQKQSGEVADKYLSKIKQKNISIRVLSFTERLMQHPDASLLQIAAPILLNSSCIDRNTKPRC